MTRMPPPEFSRLVKLDMIGTQGSSTEIAAAPDERAALADRFALQAIDRLAAEYVLAREPAGLIARGRLIADIVQSCVATGAPVPESIDERFVIRFERDAVDYAPDAEIELSEEDCDVVFFSGDRIDMGEAIAETLSLAMNPYPRSVDAERALKDAGVLSEEDASPFAKLKEIGGKDRAP